MTAASVFKWRDLLPEIILLNVRWYCGYGLSYRNLEQMIAERGITDGQPKTTQLGLVKYLNNQLEQDHRNICATDKPWNAIGFL